MSFKTYKDGKYDVWEDENGNMFWYLDGLLHRENDLPARVWSNGTKEWWINNKLHRENDLPAVERAYGTKEWYVNDKLHRENDLPAVEHADGTKEWWINNKPHRENDLPAVEWADGTKEWWFNGIRYVAKCWFVKEGIKQFERFDDLDKAKKKMREYLKQEICSWVEENSTL